MSNGRASWVYLIPERNFFRSQYSGQANHAIGCIEGVVDGECYDIWLICDREPPYLKPPVHFTSFALGKSPLHSMLELRKLIGVLQNDENVAVLQIRKNWLFVLFLCFFAGEFRRLCKLKRVIVEINGMGFVDRKFLPVKFASYVYDKLLVRNLPEECVVYTVNKNLSERVISMGFKGVSHTVPNGAPKPSGPLSGDSSSCKLVFFGVLQPYNDFEAFSEFSSFVDKVLVVGDGICRVLVEKIAESNDKIDYLGALAFSELSEKIKDGSKYFGIIPVNSSTMGSYLSPVKLYAYSALGMPVFVSSNVHLHDGDLAPHIFVYSDVKDAVKVINEIEAGELNYSYLSKAAIDFAERNSWKERMKLLGAQPGCVSRSKTVSSLGDGANVR